MEPWIERLKAACDAGYYKTEAAEGAQTGFPWQNKTCRDCPFWSNGICQVFAEYRSANTYTCSYFDAWNRKEAQAIILERRWHGYRSWWHWFNDRGAVW